MARRPEGPLKRGWTTGACATAATRAAYTALLTGAFPDPVTIRLPRGEAPAFPLAREELGADFARYHSRALELIDRRFLDRGDRRPGFFTILRAGGYQWNPSQTVRHGSRDIRLDPRDGNASSQVAHYIAAACNRSPLLPARSTPSIIKAPTNRATTVPVATPVTPQSMANTRTDETTMLTKSLSRTGSALASASCSTR